MISLRLNRNNQRANDNSAAETPGPEQSTQDSFQVALRAATAARERAVALQNAPAEATEEQTLADADKNAAGETASPQSTDANTSGTVVRQDATPTERPWKYGDPLDHSPEADSLRDDENVAAELTAAPVAVELAPPLPAALASDTATMAALLQTALGHRFAVRKPIHVGEAATVFLLEHSLHGGLFVAKVLHPKLVDKPGSIEGFRREAANAAQLGNHPHAVPVFDVVVGEPLLYLLMPYVEGADLSRILQKAGPLRREETLQLAAQISSLLAYAESCGVVHGGVSTGNIRLDTFGRYRLLDFGSSTERGREQQADNQADPLYSSPEQLEAKPLDTRSDLYSLGAVLCECLTNAPAFAGETPEAIRARHQAGDWVMPASLHPDDPLRRLLTSLLSTDPAKRPASAFELSGILHALGWAQPEFRPAQADIGPFMKPPSRRRQSK